jgi:hypothetical protein
VDDESTTTLPYSRAVSRFFTLDYVERAMLRDGTPIRIRLLAPEDKALLRRGFENWSAESRYTRFLTPKQRLSDDELRYLCEVDQETHFALGAIREVGDGRGEPVGLGIARFIRLQDRPGEPITAEAAIAVADEVARQGLGKLLFLRLCFRCEVLATNAGITSLIDQIAPQHTAEVESGLMRIDFALPNVTPDTATSEAQSSALYRFFRAAAQDVVEWTEAVRRIWRR